jgi:hypothetical protein
MIAGLANTLPKTLSAGLRAQGVPAAAAHHVASLPPVSTLFSALLGYNPVKGLLGPSGVLAKLPAHNVAVLTGHQFFPSLISAPFHHGLVIVFTAAICMSVAGALISLLRGKQFYWQEPEPAPAVETAASLAAAGVAAAQFAANGRAVSTADTAGNGEPPPARPATSYAD